jgi:hypothetical protein
VDAQAAALDEATKRISELRGALWVPKVRVGDAA